MGIPEKIKEIEEEIERTQKNKATEHHIGMLKAHIAKLQKSLIEEAAIAAGGGKGEGFDVSKSGVARVVMIGFPSVGKSSLLTSVTNAKSESAEYQFTTLTCVPGLLTLHGARVQLLDLPGIIEGAATGKGNGKQVIAVARTADLILMLLDANEADSQKRILTAELAKMGIRLNQRRPHMSLVQKDTHGISINQSYSGPCLETELIQRVLKEFRIHNADVYLHEPLTVDQLIDGITGDRVYIPCLYVYNKIDTVSMPAVDIFAHRELSCVISISMGLGIETLKEAIWSALDIVRVYTKPRSDKPDLDEPMFFRRGTKVKDVILGIHKDLLSKFKYALVWGTSAKHGGQRVGLEHVLEDEDVIQVVAAK